MNIWKLKYTINGEWYAGWERQIIEIIKIYFIVSGFFGLRCSKNPEKGRPAFVLGCIGVVVAFLQAFLTYLGYEYTSVPYCIYSIHNINRGYKTKI